MPKQKDERKGAAQDSAAKEEKFRDFFTTTVADIPAEMVRRDEEAAQKPKGVFGRLFGHAKTAKPKEEPQTGTDLELPTGEVLLGSEVQSMPDEDALDLDLTLRTAGPGTDFPQPRAEQSAPAAPEMAEEPAPAPQPERKPEPEQKPEPPRAAAPAEPAARPEKPQKKNVQNPKNAPEVLLPQEQQEQQEMQQLKDMLNGMSRPAAAAKPKPVEETLEPIRTVDVPLDDPEEPETPEKAPEPPRTTMVFAADKPLPEKKSVFRMFGDADDEAKNEAKPESAEAAEAPAAPAEEPETGSAKEEKEDTMSLPLTPLEEEPAPEAETPVAAPAAEEAAQPEGAEEGPVLKTEAEDALPAEDEAPESVGDKLRRMSAELTLRCVLAGILAVVLLHVGLVADRMLTPLAALDPDAAPAAFYAANLLLFAASLVVSFPVLRDGLNGLRGRPSAETMPALAAVAALLQAVIALLTANSYRSTEGLSILTGIAALGLFLALLGNRVMLAAVRGGYELLGETTDLQGARRAEDKDLIRALARNLEQMDPWVLLSRPQTADDSFVEQSLDERAGERRAQRNSYILLGVAVLSALLCLVVGRDVKLTAAALTAVLCMGAPLSSTLISGLAALRLQRSAAAVGAVVPGWAAIQELGGIDTIQVDADDLFTADSVTLEDIRIFKGGRIDRAILYAASVLNQCGGTLQGLFRQIIEDRTDILFPVKDLEIHRGLGFAAWCDNNHIQIGTRRFLEQEGVALPDEDYENQHSKNGELQILYLAVSGNVHAMFVIRYVGGRNIARSLAALQQENIRLLVTSLDPSLTAKHITEAYRLPEGMVTLLDQEQCAALEAAPAEDAPCCMYHQKGFASLTGGLRAADKAQNAETTATTVQMVSVLFSVAIAVLLTSARSIWQLPVTYVLMYQAAWSALSIAVCALKQHN